MKIAAIILTVLLLLSAAAFGASLLVTGANWDDVSSSFSNVDSFGVIIGGEYGESMTKDFTDEYADIEISVISAETTVSLSKDNTTRVEYKSNNSNIKLTADVINNKLVIKENSKIQLFNFGIFKKSALDISIPEKLYDRITLNTVSGSADCVGLLSEKLTVNTTSGYINLKAFADEIDVNTVSGEVKLTNYTEKRANSIKSSSTSGTVTIRGYRPESYKLSAVSGNLNMYDASGEGNISLTSGNAYVEYAEWNDGLKLSAISGNINVRLPSDSGVDLDYSRVSGGVSYDLAGEKRGINKKGEYSFGGSNKQEVKVNLTSGYVIFSDKGLNPAASEYAEATTLVITEIEIPSDIEAVYYIDPQ